VVSLEGIEARDAQSSKQGLSPDPGFLSHRSIVDRCEHPRSYGEQHSLIQWSAETRQRGEASEHLVNSWFCDLRLGPEAYISSKKALTTLAWKEPITIQSGEFGLLVTEEVISIHKDIVGFISLRFTQAVKGLVNISGRHVDPGYTGRLAFSVYNAGPRPIVIRRGEPVFMLTFATLDAAVGERTDSHVSSLEGIKSDWMAAVMGPPVSLPRLDRRITRMELWLEILAMVFVAVTASTVTWIAIGARGS
jgi:dCTP deaminase